MSAVLCLPACLCVSTAASRGQALHGNASLLLLPLDYEAVSLLAVRGVLQVALLVSGITPE